MKNTFAAAFLLVSVSLVNCYFEYDAPLIQARYGTVRVDQSTWHKFLMSTDLHRYVDIDQTEFMKVSERQIASLLQQPVSIGLSRKVECPSRNILSYIPKLTPFHAGTTSTAYILQRPQFPLDTPLILRRSKPGAYDGEAAGNINSDISHQIIATFLHHIGATNALVETYCVMSEMYTHRNYFDDGKDDYFRRMSQAGKIIPGFNYRFLNQLKYVNQIMEKVDLPMEGSTKAVWTKPSDAEQMMKTHKSQINLRQALFELVWSDLVLHTLYGQVPYDYKSGNSGFTYEPKYRVYHLGELTFVLPPGWSYRRFDLGSFYKIDENSKYGFSFRWQTFVSWFKKAYISDRAISTETDSSLKYDLIKFWATTKFSSNHKVTSFLGGLALFKPYRQENWRELCQGRECVHFQFPVKIAN